MNKPEDGTLCRCPDCGGAYVYSKSYTEPGVFGGHVVVPGQWLCDDCGKLVLDRTDDDERAER